MSDSPEEPILALSETIGEILEMNNDLNTVFENHPHRLGVPGFSDGV